MYYLSHTSHTSHTCYTKLQVQYYLSNVTQNKLWLISKLSIISLILRYRKYAFIITEEPDSYNIDYYYSKYRDRHCIGMSEAKPSTLCVLPANINPETCDASLTKKHHYFKVPTQPQLATCLCCKYHTNFTS